MFRRVYLSVFLARQPRHGGHHAVGCIRQLGKPNACFM